MTSRRRGAQSQNLNRQLRLRWLESYDLSTVEGINEVLREATRRLWTGELGSRTGDTLVRLLNLLKEGMETADIEERLEQLEAAAQQKRGEA
jgi:hypothetical protein